MKILTVIGARPQFIKAATVSRAIKEHNINSIDSIIVEKIVHTGQHYDSNMSDVFFEEMDIPKPTYTLGIGGGMHGAMTGQQLEKIEDILIKELPDYVLVYGDTNSTLAGSLAAAKLHIPVIHVEAGLRSFNMEMPEEINRILTDQISSILFCPTQTAIDNLYNEGFKNKSCKIINVGDVMYDAALFYSHNSKKPFSVEDFDGEFVLTTMHRADNTDNADNLKEIISGLNAINRITPVICPMHPRTRKVIESLSINIEFKLINPVSYFEMLWLLQNSFCVITDSGGLQKEAYFFGKLCITLREQTEWVELININANVLVGCDSSKLVNQFLFLKEQVNQFPEIQLYGDGTAAKKIINYLISSNRNQ